MSTYDRKQELERKKAKLADLRAQKNKKDAAKPVDVMNGVQTQAIATNGRLDTDELLKTLGISMAEPSADGDKKTIVNEESNLTTRAASPRKRTKLTLSKLNELSVAPKDNISYSKHTQTKELSASQQFPIALHNDSPRETLNSPRFIANLEWEDEFSMVLPFDHSLPTLLDNTNSQSVATPADHKRMISSRTGKQDGILTETMDRVLTNEERGDIFDSLKFCDFFSHASRLMERALIEPDNMFADYTGADHDETSATRHQLIHFCWDFYDERWSRKRPITALDWSPKFPELLLGAYLANEDAPNEPDGVCLIWNLKFQKNTPEYIFHCQSPVTSATLATYHPNLVIGGTYSGQIVLWDNRSSKRTPVQRTLLSATAHTHPIHSITVIGSQNAHNLISVSSDGKLCSWSLDMLSQPQQLMELTYKQTRSVAATTMSFFGEDVNNFLVGSEDGRVYSGLRHGNQAGITEMFECHQTPITAVKAHAAQGPIDFSNLFLSTSFDWTAALWSAKETRPVYVIEENADFLMDADWSPLHPAMFSIVDNFGRVNLWNLNEDIEVPAARTQIEAGTPLNKCRFHPSGLRIAAGDTLGRIHIYDLNETMVTPRADEWGMFARTLEELRQLSVERDDREEARMRMPSIH